METLERLIDDMVDVNRLQNGKFHIHFEPVRLDTLLTDVVEASQLLTTTAVVVEPGSEVAAIMGKRRCRAAATGDYQFD